MSKNMKTIMEGWRKLVRQEELNESFGNGVMFHRKTGVYVTSREPFLRAVRRMAEETQSTGDIEQALVSIEQAVDNAELQDKEMHRLLRAGQRITGGLYFTSRDSFLSAMRDAGELVMQGDYSPEEVEGIIEGNVDSGKYSDPRVRKIVSQWARSGQTLGIGKYNESAQWGNFSNGAAPLDEPVIDDGGTLPMEQLEKMWGIYTGMGMSPEDILQTPEFVEAGITSQEQLGLQERDWQKDSDKIKDHPEAKTRVLDTGANKETGGGEGHQKRDKKRGKSAPPGAGGA